MSNYRRPNYSRFTLYYSPNPFSGPCPTLLPTSRPMTPGAGICAAACCTIAVVSSLHAARQDQGSGSARQVCGQVARARLVTKRTCNGSAITNFEERLPPPQFDLAREALKDPYIFDFLNLTEDAQEHDIEQALTRHIRRFLLQLAFCYASKRTGWSPSMPCKVSQNRWASPSTSCCAKCRLRSKRNCRRFATSRRNCVPTCGMIRDALFSARLCEVVGASP